MNNPTLFITGFCIGTFFALAKTKKQKVAAFGVGVLASLVEVFLLPK